MHTLGVRYIGCPILNTECEKSKTSAMNVEPAKDEQVNCSNLPASSIVCSEYGNPEKWII